MERAHIKKQQRVKSRSQEKVQQYKNKLTSYATLVRSQNDEKQAIQAQIQDELSRSLSFINSKYGAGSSTPAAINTNNLGSPNAFNVFANSTPSLGSRKIINGRKSGISVIQDGRSVSPLNNFQYMRTKGLTSCSTSLAFRSKTLQNTNDILTNSQSNALEQEDSYLAYQTMGKENEENENYRTNVSSP